MEPSKDGQSSELSTIISDNYGSTFFEPQIDISDLQSIENDDAGPSAGRNDDNAPEKKLTLFALRLAILEKAASGLGTLGFVWATVVLLGGFAITLERKDFWFVTVILLIEGTRIFSRSHELEWQHQATWSLAEAGRSSFRALKYFNSCLLLQALQAVFRPFSIDSRRIAGDIRTLSETPRPDVEAQRTWHTSDVPLLPYAGWVFLSRNASRLLYWLQFASASSCVSLSLMRLIEQDYGAVHVGDTDRKNRRPALNIFYCLALAEALFFLAERAYWEWKVSYRRLLDQVSAECHLGACGAASIKRFFYDAYSKCLTGSIFDGLKMDLITFAEELLASSSCDEQLIGASILLKFSTSHRFADATLRKIGMSTLVIERLIEMLNWKSSAEEEIRKSAAVIVSKLAGKKQNALRVAGIPGAMESISSLLHTGHVSNPKPGEVGHQFFIADRTNYESSVFSLLGLLILKKLANDHDNCRKIGHTRGLLPKIIDFTGGGRRLGRREGVSESQIIAVKRSLQVVKKLASTTGNTGRSLRQEISEMVFTVSNIREILQYGEDHIGLQKLGIEILASLAMDEVARERIGSTGGVVKELLRIFFMTGFTRDQNSLKAVAGEALAMLALESEQNCGRILKEAGVVERLVSSLSDPVLRVHSSRILRNLCNYAGTESIFQLRGVTAGCTLVLKAILVEEMKLLEMSLGLAAQISKLMSPEEYNEELAKAGIKEIEFADKLVQILKRYSYPSIKVPRIRRFVIELAMWMMKADERYIRIFRDFGMEKELKHVSETTSELECFSVFSGSVGVSRHNIALCSLVDIALEMMGT